MMEKEEIGRLLLPTLMLTLLSLAEGKCRKLKNTPKLRMQKIGDREKPVQRPRAAHCGDNIGLHPAFDEVPRAVNATLGTPIQFTCRASAAAVFWRINGTLAVLVGFTNFTTFTRSGVMTSYLYFEATKQVNNSLVDCGILILPMDITTYSDAVYLKVQGPPGTVSRLQATPMEGLIHVNWSRPTTLNITDKEPDIWYIVEITNITNTTNLINLTCTQCPLQNSEYNFTVEIFCPCDIFEFRITAANDAGYAMKSESATAFFLSAPPPFSGNSTVNALTDGLGLKISLSLVREFCPGELPHTFRVYIQSNDSNYLYVSENIRADSLRNENGSICLVHTLQNSSLPSQQVYDITVETENNAGRTNTSVGSVCIGKEESRSGAECTLLCISGIGAGGVFVVIATTFLLPLILWMIWQRKCSRRNPNRNNTDTVPMSSNTAYEIRKPYNLQRCPAYDTVT